MSHESVRHGETVFSEAGVSDSAEGRCRDTGIQLAAAPLDVPGIVFTISAAWHASLLHLCCTSNTQPLLGLLHLAQHNGGAEVQTKLLFGQCMCHG